MSRLLTVVAFGLPAALVGLLASVGTTAQAGLLNVVSGAQAAYSLRRLDDDYTGYVVQVRRASDNAVQNIGFDAAGQLDTAAVIGFVGSGDGYITTWYDQAGTHNLVQGLVERQPQIVAAGSLLSDPVNGLPALRFSSNSLTYSGTGIGNNTMSILAAASWFPWTVPPLDTYVGRRLWTMRQGAASKAAFGGENGQFALAYAGSSVASSTTGVPIPGNTPVVTSYIYDATQAVGADTIHWYLNGDVDWSDTGLTLTGIPNVNHFDVGSLEGTMRFFDGFVQELFVYHGVLSDADRALVERNMMSLYIPEPTAFAALLCVVMLWLGWHRPRS
ncbi:MAG: arabinofuranosidase catalytic domain-containing protein [Patescibacteria group bacterium]|nr:arabinofuranosidase catalytic domain-containing protein [Patescibacteria group bacterium]